MPLKLSEIKNHFLWLFNFQYIPAYLWLYCAWLVWSLHNTQLNTCFWWHANWSIICSMRWVRCFSVWKPGQYHITDPSHTVCGPEPNPGPQGLSSNGIKYSFDDYILAHKWLPTSQWKSLICHLRTFTFRPHPSIQTPCLMTPSYEREAVVQRFSIWLRGKAWGRRRKIIRSIPSSLKTSDYLKLSCFFNVSVSLGI